jgi:hypothetical protein
MINKVLKLLKRNIVFGSILFLLSIIVYRIIAKKIESFTIVNMLIPPLKQNSIIKYAYACPINGYRCKPRIVHKIELSGQGKFSNMKFQKYKIVDVENVVRYSGLYKSNDLPIGSYVVFDNGQEYIITSFDIEKEPEDCPPNRRELKE